MPSVPSTARALVLDAYKLDHLEAIHSLHVEERTVPTPGPREVLIRVEAAACNPSDLIFLTGSYVSAKGRLEASGIEFIVVNDRPA